MTGVRHGVVAVFGAPWTAPIRTQPRLDPRSAAIVARLSRKPAHANLYRKTIANLSGSGAGGVTGTGISRLAGVLRVSEMRARSVPHALAFSSDTVCKRGFCFPATKTDGTSTRADCIPEGARVQLDPSIDLNRLRGLTAGERVVAKALQRYGAYVVDGGAASMAIGFEKPTDAVDPYPGAGLSWDYFAMRHIP